MFAQDDFGNVRGLNNNIYPSFYGSVDSGLLWAAHFIGHACINIWRSFVTNKSFVITI